MQDKELWTVGKQKTEMTEVARSSWEHASKIYFYQKTYFCKLVEDTDLE